MRFLVSNAQFNMGEPRLAIVDCKLPPVSQADLYSGLPTLILVFAACLLTGLLVCHFALRRQVLAGHSNRSNRPFVVDWTDLSENRRKLLLYSIAIMSLVTLAVLTLAEVMLYLTSFEQQRNRLIEMASAQARLIEAVARFDREHSNTAVDGGALAATISQIIDAHQHQSGLGKTGEFTLARLDGGQMAFLLHRRHGEPNQSMRVPFAGSPLAEPMRRALSGRSGTTVGKDYRGELVLAAYEPVQEIDFGIVAKIDIDEIRTPFLKAALAGLGMATLLIMAGGLVLVRVNAPLLKRLDEREQRLNAIVTNVFDAIFTVDDRGTILSFNPAAESIFGYDGGEIVGQNASILVANESGSADGELNYQNLTGERYELVGRRRNGERFPMDVALNAMDNGKPLTLVGIARDNTRQKQMEEELRRINFLSDIALDLTGCGYWHIDYRDPEYYYQSKRASRMLGEPDKPDGRYHLRDEWFSRLLAADPQTAETTIQRYQGALDGRYDHYEAVYPYKRPVDGRTIWLHALGRVDRDENGQVCFMFGAYQDVTRQKEAEATAEHARRAAEEANRAKSEFLSRMSHELRTPLNGILGYAQILQRSGLVGPAHQQNVRAIMNCGEHLLTLINDVLDLSKIEAGRMEVELRPCNLYELINAVSDVVRQRALDKGLEYKTEISDGIPERIVTDAAKLRQILINLAGNAIKFTEKGSVIIRATENPENTLLLDVIDTGVGISAQEQEVIFDAFRQVAAGKNAGGTGLGLAISRQLAEAMDGELRVESQTGQGSRFTVALPLIAADGDATMALPTDESLMGETVRLVPGQTSTVLVADDRETNRDVLRLLLEDLGFGVLSAVDGLEALELMRETDQIDLVLMDVRMPRMDGIAAVEAIRADQDLKDLKVIAVTASVFPDFRQQAIEAGFDDFLAKPFRADELVRKLQKHLTLKFENLSDPEIPGPGISQTPDKSFSQKLPAELQERLRRAVQIRNLTAMYEVADELLSQSETVGMGQRIHELASRFQFSDLERWLDGLDD